MSRRIAMVAAGVALVVVVGTLVSADPAEDRQGDPSPATGTVHLESLDEVHDWLLDCGATTSCARLVYLWSPGMPLSADAIPHLSDAAHELGLPVSILPVEALHVVDPDDLTPRAESLRALLVAAGATVHYPSMVLFDGTEPAGTAIVGYREAEGYRALLEPRVLALRDGETTGPRPEAAGTALSASPEHRAEPASRASSTPSASTPPRPRATTAEIEILWRQAMVPPPGFFFRRALGTRYISFDQRGRVVLQHLETGMKHLAPGFIDFVPTPDGDLFVTPSHNRGLEFYMADDVFTAARTGRGADLPPIFRDPQMDDQYPSVGILSRDPGVSTTYRILVSWFRGLAMREYRVDWADDGSMTVHPLGPRTTPCAEMSLSTPILSKDGTEIAARGESTGTTKVFRYRDDGTCTEVHDFGFPTSKVGFSDDGRLIAYSTPDGADGTSMTHVWNRDTDETLRIPLSSSRGLMIPEFVGPDSLLFIVTDGTRSGAHEFRLVCCVR